MNISRRAALAIFISTIASYLSGPPMPSWARAEMPALAEVSRVEAVGSARINMLAAHVALAKWKLKSLQQLRQQGHASWLECARAAVHLQQLQAELDTEQEFARVLRGLRIQIDTTLSSLDEQLYREAAIHAYAVRLSLPGSVRLVYWLEPHRLPPDLARRHLALARQLAELDDATHYQLQIATAELELAQENLRQRISIVADPDAAELRRAELDLAIATAEVGLARARYERQRSDVEQFRVLEARCESTPARDFDFEPALSSSRIRQNSGLSRRLAVPNSGESGYVAQERVTPKARAGERDCDGRDRTADSMHRDHSYDASLEQPCWLLYATLAVAAAESSATGESQAAEIELQLQAARLKAVGQLHAGGFATQAELQEASQRVEAAKTLVEQWRARRAWLAESCESLQRSSADGQSGAPSITKSSGGKPPQLDVLPAQLLVHAPAVRHWIELQRQQLQATARRRGLLAELELRQSKHYAKLNRVPPTSFRGKRELEWAAGRRDQVAAQILAAEESSRALDLEKQRFVCQLGVQFDASRCQVRPHAYFVASDVNGLIRIVAAGAANESATPAAMTSALEYWNERADRLRTVVNSHPAANRDGNQAKRELAIAQQQLNQLNNLPRVSRLQSEQLRAVEHLIADAFGQSP